MSLSNDSEEIRSPATTPSAHNHKPLCPIEGHSWITADVPRHIQVATALLRDFENGIILADDAASSVQSFLGTTSFPRKVLDIAYELYCLTMKEVDLGNGKAPILSTDRSGAYWLNGDAATALIAPYVTTAS